MQTYARIYGGIVVERIATDRDITMMFHPSLVWVDVSGISPQPQEGWSATETAGAWSFAAPALPALAELKLDKLRDLDTAYAAAITQPVSYMGTTFQADPASVELMNRAINVYTAAGSVPEGFWWLDAENNKVPMTLAQLQGLGQAVADRVWTSFQHLQNLKDAVRDPDLTDPEDLAAIVW
jgi:hypothetical protein